MFFQALIFDFKNFLILIETSKFDCNFFFEPLEVSTFDLKRLLKTSTFGVKKNLETLRKASKFDSKLLSTFEIVNFQYQKMI